MNKEFIRNSVAKCMLNNKIMNFPVNANEIKLPSKIVKVRSYFESTQFFESSNLIEYSKTRNGFIIHKEENLYYLFYNEILSHTEKDYTFAHEFGHVDLGHSIIGLHLGKAILPDADNEQEMEAEYYAMYYKAHPAVLYKAGIKSAMQISMITGLSIEKSKIISMEISKMTDKSLTIDEIRLCEQFAVFINEYKDIHKYDSFFKKHKSHKDKGKLYIALLVLSCIVTVIFFNCYNPFLADNSQENLKPLTVTYNEKSYIYVTPSGKKFHKSDCRYINKDTAKKITINKALHEGYGACKVCKPLDE